MLRLNRMIIGAAIVLLFSIQITMAQSDSVMQLGGFLDQQATTNALPTGDGLVSPVEQSVASAFIDEITGFNQAVTDFQQASPANKTWLDTVEQRTATYQQQIDAAGTNAPVDVRAEIISNAVAQYGQDVETVQAQNAFDIRAQIISDAVAQYGKDATALQAEAPNDPRADAISHAVAQYGQQLDALQAGTAPDPRASAISQAVAQYGQDVSGRLGQPLSSATTQTIIKTLREGTHEYIKRSSIARKTIVIRHIDEMMPGDFDNHNEQLELLPGFWRHTSSTMTMTGVCKSAAMGVGSNPDGGGDSPTPVIPLVPIYQSTAGDFLFIDSYPYGLLEPKVYGKTTTERQLVMQNGATSGSINTSNTTEYRIVASDLIGVRKIYTEDGGCTIEYNSMYELVQMDTSIVVDDIETPQPASTPIATPMATMQPTTTPQPIPSGTYPVTWTVDSGTCTDKTQPTFTQAKIDYTNNGDMLLRLGNDEHTLFPVGSDDNIRYQLISSERQITVQLLSGVIKMDWGKFAGTAMCFKSGELGSTATTAATPVPTLNSTATPVAASNSQQYQVNFKPDEQMCPQAVRDKLPAFDGATFEALPNGGYQLVVGDQIYIFKDNSGYSIYDGSDPKKGITYQIALAYADQNGGQLGLTYMNASGAFCLSEMSLSSK